MKIERQETWWLQRSPVVQDIGNLLHDASIVNTLKRADREKSTKFVYDPLKVNDSVESIVTVALMSKAVLVPQYDLEELSMGVLTYCMEANVYEEPGYLKQFKQYFLRGIVTSLLKTKDATLARVEIDSALEEIGSLFDTAFDPRQQGWY